jgi:hypothetical protein
LTFMQSSKSSTHTFPSGSTPSSISSLGTSSPSSSMSLWPVRAWWFRTQLVYEHDYAFGDAYSNAATKSSMLSEDKLAIEMISLMRGGHGGAQGLELGL